MHILHRPPLHPPLQLWPTALRPFPARTRPQFLNQHTNSPARASLLEHSDDLLWFVALGATPGSDTTTSTVSHDGEEGGSKSRGNGSTGRSGSASSNSNSGREGGLPAAGGPPVWLRRNTAELPPELHPGGARFAKVDWFWSLCLNLVVQCKYGLTVVQCRCALLSSS